MSICIFLENLGCFINFEMNVGKEGGMLGMIWSMEMIRVHRPPH
jgi:hypothetical protein